MHNRHRKERVGTVLNSKLERTAVVEVVRLVAHPTYGKVVRLRKRYVAHDAKKMTKVGDKVRIVETRPISRTKRWQVAEVLSSSK